MYFSLQIRKRTFRHDESRKERVDAHIISCSARYDATTYNGDARPVVGVAAANVQVSVTADHGDVSKSSDAVSVAQEPASTRRLARCDRAAGEEDVRSSLEARAGGYI